MNPNGDHNFELVEEVRGFRSYRHRSNGLRALLLPEGAVQVSVFMITYQVGSRNEGPGTTGATHLLEHMMFKGSERFNDELGTAVFPVLQRVGARVNASTWMDRTNYYEMLPTEHLKLAMDIEADRMRGLLLRERDLEQERTVVLNERDRGENSPLRTLYDSVWSTAFFAHPYGHPTIGWKSDIQAISKAELQRYYDQFYWPNNATASVIGRFELDEALSMLDAAFGSIPPSPHTIPQVVTREPAQRGERRVVVRRPGQLGVVLKVFRMPSALDKDTDALDVLARILGQGMTSRLYKELTDAGRTTGVSASASRLKDDGLFQVYAMLSDSADHDAVESEMLRVFSEVRDAGVSNEEVVRAKARIRANIAFSRDGPFVSAAQLNEAIAAGDWKLYADYEDRIAEVTADDVTRVARSYLKDDTSVTGIYIPTKH